MPNTPEQQRLGGIHPLIDSIASRRMVRSYFDSPIDDDTLEQIIRAVHAGPSAGNTRSLELLVLRGAERAAYWDVTLPEAKRPAFHWPGLLRAPVLLVPYVDPLAYVERYSEDDKAATGLGEGLEAWPVPFWWVDGGAAAQNALLAAHALGLGACLFGQFDHEEPLKRHFGVPEERRAICTIAIGQPDDANDRRSLSVKRPRRGLDEITHHGRWES